MKDAIIKNALMPLIDKANEVNLNAALSNSYGLPVAIGTPHNYLNTLSSTKSVLELFELMRKYETVNFKNRRIMVKIFDYGCGVGNVLSLLANIIARDRILFPKLISIKVIGLERSMALMSAAQHHLKDVTPFVKLWRTNLANLCLDDLHYLRSIEDETITTFEIHYCKRVFKDLQKQAIVERAVIEFVQIGSYLMLPDGIITSPKLGVKRINNKLIKITGNVVY